MTLASLSEAIDWARSHWQEQRTAPIHLHKHDNEGLGPFYSAAFQAHLSQSDRAVADVNTNRPCTHWRRAVGELCPDCSLRDEQGKPIVETGVYAKRERRFLFAMTIALEALRSARNETPRHPHPYHLVIVLASHGWNAPQAARALTRHWDVAEPLFLRAIRQLHGRYQAGPVMTSTSAGWVDLSDSQRAAIEAGETAA